MIETKRLRIYPATREKMETIIAAETDAGLKAAYTQMLDGCLQYPDQWEWYAMWMIELRGGMHIGDLCFKGLDANGMAEIGYGILEDYQGQGYATEAVGAAVAWALRQPAVTRVEAETEPDNRASHRVLEKCGFLPSGTFGEEGPRFYTEERQNEEEWSVFSADMIAPCGLDCSICSRAQIEDNPCPGCNGPDQNKPDFCANRCGIILCKKRRDNGYTYCDECPDYPCDDVMEKENRYTSQYPLRESPLENLGMIREKGMEAFLKQERRIWTCLNCGSPICVHTGICSGCKARIERKL